MIKYARGLGSQLNQRDVEARKAKACQILNRPIDKSSAREERIVERNKRSKSSITENSELIKQVMNGSEEKQQKKVSAR